MNTKYRENENTALISAEVKNNLEDKLKFFFGYHHFKGNQKVIIENILAGRNTFILMPTGAGKSLCYQLPALLSKGLVIVISPLIALMKNQVDQLNAYGINAKFLNSTLGKGEVTRLKKECASQTLEILYIAPESLTKEDTISFLQKVKISFIAIDEAHCISEWGHDFRPEYRRIKAMVSALGNPPVMALTATATPKVQMDIQKNLQMDTVDVFTSSFNRKNLYYEVRSKKGVKKQLIHFLKEHEGKSGIIYCLSRKKVEEVVEFININGFKAAPYHAGLDGAIRSKNQDNFLNEKVDVIVATIAFGMGIDKPDVRFVVHYDVPKSVEGYYQETGRSGRDDLGANCLLFFSQKDLQKLEKFHKDKPVHERENARLLLQEMAFYAASPVCRRRQLLHYFGESFSEKNCGMCDNCRNPSTLFEGSKSAHLALTTVEKTEGRVGLKHLIHVLRGEQDDYVVSHGHTDLSVFGKGKKESEDYWASIFRQLLVFEFLKKNIESIDILQLTPKGEEFIKKPHHIEFALHRDYSQEEEEDISELSRFYSTKSYDPNLYSLLKDLQQKVGDQHKLPPYVIFQEFSLEEMATTYPITEESLASVNGVSMGKVKRFGEPFLKLIQKYVADNKIESFLDTVVKSSVNKSKSKVFIIQQIDRKVDLDEIAELRKLSFDELLSKIEHICSSGVHLNIDYYVSKIISDSLQEDVIHYFLQSETDSIDDALDYFPDEDEKDIRLLRIQFLNKYAH